MSDERGLKTAVEVAGGSEDAPEDEAEQMNLLPLAPAQDVQEERQPVQRGPGRPPGARNKKTKEWVEFLLGQYRSPLVALAETFNRPVDLLAKELGCSRKGAFQFQLSAARELAPYLHQKLPQAVEVSGDALPIINLNVSGQVDDMIHQVDQEEKSPLGSFEVLDMEDTSENEENQGVTETGREDV